MDKKDSYLLNNKAGYTQLRPHNLLFFDELRKDNCYGQV